MLFFFFFWILLIDYGYFLGIKIVSIFFFFRNIVYAAGNGTNPDSTYLVKNNFYLHLDYGFGGVSFCSTLRLFTAMDPRSCSFHYESTYLQLRGQAKTERNIVFTFRYQVTGLISRYCMSIDMYLAFWEPWELRCSPSLAFLVTFGSSWVEVLDFCWTVYFYHR